MKRSKEFKKAILAALTVYTIWGFTFLASDVAQRSVTPFVLLLGLFSVAVMSFDLIFLPAFENFFPEDKNG